MNEEHSPEIVSIAQLCIKMGVSRSRYYQLLSGGFILPPIYSIDSRRAYYTRELAERNLSVVRNNVGLNGKVCLFYHTRRRTGTIPVQAVNSTKKVPAKKTANSYQDLIEQLACLGLPDVKSAQVEAVIHKIYPDGIQNSEAGEVLKAVYRAIVKQNSTDNPNR